MIKAWIKGRDRRELLGAFIGGSLLVMVLTLTATAAYFSRVFAEKEGQRAEISKDQVIHFFAFQYSQMGEEMWSGSYEAIAARVGLIAKEMGGAQYEVTLADENTSCVFKGTATTSSNKCDLPQSISQLLHSPQSPSSWKPNLKFDEESRTYIYSVPLYVGSRLKGYLQAVLTDPYEFYRGSTLGVMAKALLPAMMFILAVWFAWLVACRKFFLKPYLRNLEEMKNNEALARLAGQTAHDMRDPLSWIDKLTASLHQIPEDKRVMIKSAVLQLKDIANGLLSHSRVFATEKKGVRSLDDADIELLPSIVGRIVSEKRTQFKSRVNVEIEAPLDAECYGMFARIQPNEFKRVLSNLINNAVDAVESKGRVSVKICSCESHVKVRVIDNGKGIPTEVLPKLGALGATFGKKRGNGLGLYHAKTVVESWGGSLEIESEVGKGTMVEIRLPSVTPPHWFVPSLNLPPRTQIAVLDDHPSIHQVWNDRFESYADVRIHHFTSAEELMRWYDKLSDKGGVLLLCDYELIGQTRNGLDLIEELDLRNRAILVSSHYEDDEIRDGCLILGVRLIPKELAPFVPIHVATEDASILLASTEPQLASNQPGAV